MKGLRCITAEIFTSLALLAVLPAISHGAFISSSTGADGAWTATTGAVQLPESGVFNFTTVNIPTGVNVTFLKNSKNTPVTILASGDVTISGTLSVNGSDAGPGGPGGFDGGAAGSIYGSGYRGLGPGGGAGGAYGSNAGGGGGFATAGATYSGVGGIAYGNDGQLPMVGGSGGGGSGGTSSGYGYVGGGGGGAILIASSGTITVTGSLSANGGNPYYFNYNGSYSYYGGGGAGGGIRLVATTISGSNNSITAIGGLNGKPVAGGTGRIRLETWNLNVASTNPAYTFLANPSAALPSTLPTLAISSVGGVAVPAVPKGDTRTPDIQLPANSTNPVTIVVNATAIPVGTIVTVRTLSSIGNTINTASSGLAGADASSTTASVSLNLPVAAYSSLLTVSATYTAVAANCMPLYAEGERVEKIRVDTAMGGGSTVIYITESGREIAVKPS